MREEEKKYSMDTCVVLFHIGVGVWVGWEGIDMIFSRGLCAAPLLSGCLALVLI